MSKSGSGDDFQFEISLSVLNHLGRNLYRNFITILGEAISNSWDADAENVWITINPEERYLTIKDDGIGMTAADFQEKFLKIGYSKRKGGKYNSEKRNRVFIGSKGIGKLALLSCAEKVEILTKTENSDYVGGLIDNRGLDDAIQDDMKPGEYPLERVNIAHFEGLRENLESGTLIYFENLNQDLRNTIAQLRKLIALHFRFPLHDENFKIFVNDEIISVNDLRDLFSKTQFFWRLNSFQDVFIDSFQDYTKNSKDLSVGGQVSGFLASVETPRNLNIVGTGEKITVDLYVNGRLREKNLLRRMQSNQLVETYLYGQIHFDVIDAPSDANKDPFTSSREGVVEGNSHYETLIDILKDSILPTVRKDWDEWRVGLRQQGDPEGNAVTPKERAAISLSSAISDDFRSAGGQGGGGNGGSGGRASGDDDEKPDTDLVDKWINEIEKENQFSLEAYGDCFVSENIIRRYIEFKSTDIAHLGKMVLNYKKIENDYLSEGNLNISIRKSSKDVDYLGMKEMVSSIEDVDPKTFKDDPNNFTSPSLYLDALQYSTLRNVVGHTGFVTEEGKTKMRSIYDNIKARVKDLLA